MPAGNIFLIVANRNIHVAEELFLARGFGENGSNHLSTQVYMDPDDFYNTYVQGRNKGILSEMVRDDTRKDVAAVSAFKKRLRSASPDHELAHPHSFVLETVQSEYCGYKQNSRVRFPKLVREAGVARPLITVVPISGVRKSARLATRDRSPLVPLRIEPEVVRSKIGHEIICLLDSP
jgi:hypothetical protein